MQSLDSTSEIVKIHKLNVVGQMENATASHCPALLSALYTAYTIQPIFVDYSI